MIIIGKDKIYRNIDKVLRPSKANKDAEIAQHFGEVCKASGQICRLLQLRNEEEIGEIANILNELAIAIEKEGAENVSADESPKKQRRVAASKVKNHRWIGRFFGRRTQPV